MTKISDTLYDKDFHAWSQEQARLVRERAFDRLDIDNIAEELESLGRSEQARLARHFELYLMHRLKWEYQPEMRSRSWTLTMKEQHRQAVRLVRKNPSLKPLVRELFEDAYLSARVHALNETGIGEDEIPTECTFDVADCFPELVEA
jgi:hypothetical protein